MKSWLRACVLVGLLLFPSATTAHHRPQDIQTALASAVFLTDPTGNGSGVVVSVHGERLILTAKHVAIIPKNLAMKVWWKNSENILDYSYTDVELVTTSVSNLGKTG